MDCETIKQLIQTTLPDANIQVSGDDGVHFEATVVSQQFDGLNRLKRHRLVYSALGELMGREIHALTLTTLTSEEQER